MRVLLAGPIETAALRSSLGLRLTGAPPGLTQTPIAPLAGALRALGHDVCIATLDPTVEKPLAFNEDGFSIVYLPFRGAPRYRARVRSSDLFRVEIAYLTQAISDAKPDVVHAHWTYEYAEAAVRSRLPHLVTMHDLGWDYFFAMPDAYRFIRLVMKCRTMPRVRNLSVVAPFMSPKVWQYGYFGPVAVIPNGIVMPEIETTAVSGRVHRPLRIATVGNAGPIKNVRRSIEAFRLIRVEQPDAELHLFGPGLDERFAAGELNVVGHGNVSNDDLREFLRTQATLLVHPSRLETFGVIIVEAKAVGLPVVAGIKAGGVPYVCGSDAGCDLVDIDSPEAIADGIMRTIRNPELYEKRSLRALKDARQRFDIKVVTSMFVNEYERIIEHSFKN